MDQDGQLTFDDDPKSLKLRAANNCLKLGEFGKAAALFNEIFDMDPDFAVAETGIRTAEFWNNRLEHLQSLDDGLEKGKYLKEAWNRFEEFIGHGKNELESPILSVRNYVFTEAIHCFSRAYSTTVSPDISIVYDIGECYFNIGDYLHAVETFEYAWEFRRTDSRILARLADAYYMLPDSESSEHIDPGKKSRLLFREAFLYTPEEIELERIHTPYIQRLVQAVSGEGFSGKEVAVWLPVYAAINRVFTVKRELEEHEANQISEQVFRLEQELKESGANARLLLAKLLNRYLWLIDHYQLEKNDSLKVELLKKKFKEKDLQSYKRIFE